VPRPLARTAFALAVTVGVGLVAGGTAAVAAPRPQAQPEQCDDLQRDRSRRCVGPVVDESGGGGDTVTIVVSVVVGIAVAGIAFVLLRRQLRQGAPR
jgi:hypothetical protein